MKGYRKLIAACTAMICGTLAAWQHCLSPELVTVLGAAVGIFTYANSKAADKKP